MPISYREVEYKRNKRFDKKIDKREPIRAVIVDSLGNDSGSGSIWADENLRRVWIRELGTAGASQIPCYNITPVIGLGVIVGYEPYSDIREVLSSDKKFLGQTNPDGRSYESPSTMDFRPGGRFQLWLASKLIEPLATYPSSATGLTVNVVVGDYPYAGTRKTFAGQANVPLTQNPNAGQHYYAGLYLDAANTLQIVYGASVVLATTPPEPSWPAGAFRLSVVRVNDTQTNITLSTDTDTDNDIFDRRMPWSDTNSGGNVWPRADQNMLDGVNYVTVALLIAAMGSGDIGHLGERASAEAVTLNVASVTLRGVGASATIFQGIFSITATSSRVREISIDSSGTNARGFDIHINGTAVLEDCEAACFGTTTSRALDVSTPGAGATVTVIGGRYEGLGTLPFDIYSDTDCVVELRGPVLANQTIGGPGDVTGYYYDDAGNLYFVPTTGMSGGVWRYRPDGLRIKESTIALAQTNGADGDEVHLYPGTYDLGSGLSLTKRLHFVGEGDPRSIIITGSGNFTLEPTDAGCTFRNLTILNTAGGGTDRTIIQSNVNNCVYENCILTKTGAADDSACILQYGGTGTQIINCELTTTGATKNYAIWNNTATATIEVRGGKLSGSTWDILGDQAGSSIDLIDPVLVNNLLSFSGTKEGWYFDGSGHHYAASLSRLIWTPPAFSVHKNGTDQTGIVTATFTKLTWSTEAFDTHGWFASSTYTPLLAGKYLFVCSAYFTAATDQIIMYGLLYKNGAIADHYISNTSGTVGHIVKGATLVEANGSTDYFEMYVYQTTGSNKIIQGNPAVTYFSGFYVGR